jgi:hypothetical protein
MKLAMLAPVAWRTPPEHYGPWESIASLLTEGLVGRGVDVTLFATLDSVTAAALDGVCPHGYATNARPTGAAAGRHRPAAHAHCGSLVPCPADPGGQHPVPPPGCPAAS